MRRSIMLLLPLLGACMTAPSAWRHPELPKENWARDESACTAWATREAEREASRDYDIASDRGEAIGRSTSVAAQSTFQDNRRRRGRLLHECMTNRGYLPAR